MMVGELLNEAVETSEGNCPNPGFEAFQGLFHRNLKTGAFHLALCWKAVDNKQSSA
jgi:hypothetical protein